MQKGRSGFRGEGSCLLHRKGEKLMQPLELYIHIPFCVKKCAYCDFLSGPAGEKEKEEYVKMLIEEIRSCPDAVKDYQIVSIFFGGGTPSLLTGEQIGQLMDAVRETFTLDEDAEITMEMNPGTVTEEKMRKYRNAGVNRLSIGLQSVNNEELRLLGRIHTYEGFLEAYRLARASGFSNINVDLISAIPGQTVESWRRTLEQVMALCPEHISAYSLILEEGTPFYQIYGEADQRRREDEPQSLLPSEEEEREMYEDTGRILAAHGYHRYEISNYAKKGKECRHNCGYWTGVEYKGFGLGASSLLQKRRYRNTESLENYLDGDWQPEMVEALTRENEMEETVILGLRMMEGVSEEKFYRKYGKRLTDVYGEIIRKYAKMGLMEADKQGIRLTESGISVSNVILSDFLISE